MVRSAPNALLCALLIACGAHGATPAAPKRPPPPPEPTAEELAERAAREERARMARKLALRLELQGVAAVEPGAGPGLEPDDSWPPAAPAAGPSQVAVWRGGEQVQLIERTEAQQAGLMVLDVGTEWVPALFRSTPDIPHAYESVFSDLANERFADDAQGRRARRDRYLELHGIPPSPAVLARRFESMARRKCAHEVPAGALLEFEGARWEQKTPPTPEVAPEVADALRARLHCESHLQRRHSGPLGGTTRVALEEFERRNRIYARGSLKGETLQALKQPPLELERRALLRVLTERMVLELGVIEDGSAEYRVPEGEQVGRRAHVSRAPDVVGAVRRAVRDAFGLGDVEGARLLYRRLRDVLQRPHYFVAIPAVELPDYHSADMDLFVEIDRGDIYYEFPFDESWERRDLPIEEHPVLTIFARTREKVGRRRRTREVVLPLATYGTTIGGWRIQRQNGRAQWTYKESPVGARVWSRIDSTPVWLPPAGTPPETLVYQTRTGDDGEPEWEVNDNIVGPGYASAYGLVAAYHQRFDIRRGRRVPTGDEGIRSHGSSDYTSIWQRASLGCHRLHNHLAIRLFNFVLAHREHRRVGHRTAGFRMPVSVEGFSTVIEVSRTGYGFELDQPLPVEVLRGQIKGKLKRASKRRVPVRDDQETNGPS